MVPENIDEIAATPLNFVIGKERSGTTLLQVMLNAHPNIVAPPESRFIIRLYIKYGSVKEWTEKRIKSFCDNLFVEPIFRDYWGIDKDRLYASLVSVKDKLTYPLLCKLIFYHYSASKDARIFIDKNPLYYNFIPELCEIFPSAKFVHIVRDYRANILSHGHVANLNLDTADMAYRWMKVHMIIEEQKCRLPEQWLTIKYEALVTNPEEVIRSVCDFFGIPFDKRMIEEHNKKLFPSFYNRKDEQFEKFHKRMFEPISTAFVDEWKEKMSKHDQAIAELITGKYAEETYGYKMYAGTDNAKISRFKLLRVKVKYGLTEKYFHLLKHRWIYFFHLYFVVQVLKIFSKNKP